MPSIPCSRSLLIATPQKLSVLVVVNFLSSIEFQLQDVFAAVHARHEGNAFPSDRVQDELSFLASHDPLDDAFHVGNEVLAEDIFVEDIHVDD